MAMVYAETIVELGAVPSTGTVGGSFDCEHHGVVAATV
jgi:putative transposase